MSTIIEQISEAVNELVVNVTVCSMVDIIKKFTEHFNIDSLDENDISDFVEFITNELKQTIKTQSIISEKSSPKRTIIQSTSSALMPATSTIQIIDLEKCHAITALGKQCTRKPKSGEFCGHHKHEQKHGTVDDSELFIHPHQTHIQTQPNIKQSVINHSIVNETSTTPTLVSTATTEIDSIEKQPQTTSVTSTRKLGTFFLKPSRD